MVYRESNEINGEKNVRLSWESKKKFDSEGKTIAPPHVSNGPPLTSCYSFNNFCNWLKISNQFKFSLL